MNGNGFRSFMKTVSAEGPNLKSAIDSLMAEALKECNRGYVLYTDSNTVTGKFNPSAASFDIKKACTKSE